MSKRQRFFVELIPNEVTVISWKKLLADHAAKRMIPTATSTPKLPNTDLPAKTTVTTAGSSQLTIGFNHHATTLKNSTESNPLTKLKLKLPTVVSYYRKRKPGEMKLEETESEHVGVMAKGKVHRSMPAIAKTSCRTKKKTKACFCCPQKDQT